MLPLMTPSFELFSKAKRQRRQRQRQQKKRILVILASLQALKPKDGGGMGETSEGNGGKFLCHRKLERLDGEALEAVLSI